MSWCFSFSVMASLWLGGVATGGGHAKSRVITNAERADSFDSKSGRPTLRSSLESGAIECHGRVASSARRGLDLGSRGDGNGKQPAVIAAEFQRILYLPDRGILDRAANLGRETGHPCCYSPHLASERPSIQVEDKQRTGHRRSIVATLCKAEPSSKSVRPTSGRI